MIPLTACLVPPVFPGPRTVPALAGGPARPLTRGRAGRSKERHPHPPQLTVGSSGGPLDNGPDDNKVMGQLIGTPLQAVHKSITAEVNPAGGVGIFGYAVLEDNGGTWKLAFQTRPAVP
jgi:hypothetical protein